MELWIMHTLLVELWITAYIIDGIMNYKVLYFYVFWKLDDWALLLSLRIENQTYY